MFLRAENNREQGKYITARSVLEQMKERELLNPVSDPRKNSSNIFRLFKMTNKDSSGLSTSIGGQTLGKSFGSTASEADTVLTDTTKNGMLDVSVENNSSYKWELDVGGRAIKAFLRPYPVFTDGIPVTISFDLDSSKKVFRFGIYFIYIYFKI